MTFLNRLGIWMLWPGNAVCNYFKVEEDSNRQLLRMFVNLTIYAKVAGVFIYWLSM